MRRNIALIIVPVIVLLAGAGIYIQMNDDDATEKAEKKYALVAEIFMFADASESQIEGVASELEKDLEAEKFVKVEYFDKDEAYEFFKKSFADDPELIESTSKDDIPVSFLISFLGETKDDELEDLTDRYRELDGVDTIRVNDQRNDSITDKEEETSK